MHIPSFRWLRFGALAFVSLCLSTGAWASDNPSYTQTGRDIDIGQNQQVGDLTCFGCSIRVRGQVAGDVTAFAGNIVLEDQAQVSGDVTTIAGDMRLDEGVKVAGDATVIGGQLRRDPQSSVSGDITSLGGRGWFWPILLAPFMMLGLLIAFVVWLVQRLRTPSVPAAAA
jgi:cytoskeletal protein CcmA (bactofilin family)